jgi:hypothetical protein
MDINIELGKVGLKQTINLQCNVGDCLFEAITYLLKYFITSWMIQKNSMSHFFFKKNLMHLKFCNVVGEN